MIALPVGWTHEVGSEGDTLRGPLEDDAQQVIDVHVDPGYPEQVRMVAGLLVSGMPDDWPDVTWHRTFLSLRRELAYYLTQRTAVSCPQCDGPAWDEEFAGTRTVFCARCEV